MKNPKIGQIVRIKNKSELDLDKTKLYFVKDKLIGDDRIIIATVDDKANVIVDEYYGSVTLSMENSHVVECRDLKLVAEQSYDITTWGFAIDILVNDKPIMLTDEDFEVIKRDYIQCYILKSLFEIEGFDYYVVIDKQTGDFKYMKIETSMKNPFEFVKTCLVHLLYNKPTEKEYETFVKHQTFKSRTLWNYRS